MEVGKVYLVGAGIGSIYHLTRRAFGLIKRADVVVYDRLVNPELLKFAPYEAEFIDVGKMPNHHKVPQGEIEDILVQKAREGKRVVRLKAGDPYIFGRGGEEALRLEKEKIPWEVIPGLSSSIVGGTYGGIPITFRNKATSFHVVTASLKEGESFVHWEPLARLDGTLVLMMGVSKAEEISGQLVHFGKDESTSVAVVEWAGWAKQKKVITTLKDLPKSIEDNGIKAPAVIIVGDVADLADTLNFFEKKPLFGKKIGLLTRPSAHEGESEIAWALEELGAEISLLPLPKMTDDNQLVFPPTLFTQDIWVDGIIVPSSKAAEEGFKDFGALKVPLFTLGEKTSKALSNWNFSEILESKNPSIESLMNLIEEYFEGK